MTLEAKVTTSNAAPWGRGRLARLLREPGSGVFAEAPHQPIKAVRTSAFPNHLNACLEIELAIHPTKTPDERPGPSGLELPRRASLPGECSLIFSTGS